MGTQNATGDSMRNVRLTGSSCRDHWATAASPLNTSRSVRRATDRDFRPTSVVRARSRCRPVTLAESGGRVVAIVSWLCATLARAHDIVDEKTRSNLMHETCIRRSHRLLSAQNTSIQFQIAREVAGRPNSPCIIRARGPNHSWAASTMPRARARLPRASRRVWRAPSIAPLVRFGTAQP